MPLDHLAAMAFNHFLGRMLRRALIAVTMALFAVVAIYHFTVAGTIALEEQFGELHAQLIVGGIYLTLTLLCVVVLWGMRTKSPSAGTPTLPATREMQMVMLVEAVMLGYALAQKGGRTN